MTSHHQTVIIEHRGERLVGIGSWSAAGSVVRMIEPFPGLHMETGTLILARPLMMRLTLAEIERGLQARLVEVFEEQLAVEAAVAALGERFGSVEAGEDWL